MSAPAVAVTVNAAISPTSRGSCHSLKNHTNAATIAAAVADKRYFEGLPSPSAAAA